MSDTITDDKPDAAHAKAVRAWMTPEGLAPCPVCGGPVGREDGSTFRWTRITCLGACGASWELRADDAEAGWAEVRRDVEQAIAASPTVRAVTDELRRLREQVLALSHQLTPTHRRHLLKPSRGASAEPYYDPAEADRAEARRAKTDGDLFDRARLAECERMAERAKDDPILGPQARARADRARVELQEMEARDE